MLEGIASAAEGGGITIIVCSHLLGSDLALHDLHINVRPEGEHDGDTYVF